MWQWENRVGLWKGQSRDFFFKKILKLLFDSLIHVYVVILFISRRWLKNLQVLLLLQRRRALTMKMAIESELNLTKSWKEKKRKRGRRRRRNTRKRKRTKKEKKKKKNNILCKLPQLTLRCECNVMVHSSQMCSHFLYFHALPWRPVLNGCRSSSLLHWLIPGIICICFLDEILCPPQEI